MVSEIVRNLRGNCAPVLLEWRMFIFCPKYFQRIPLNLFLSYARHLIDLLGLNNRMATVKHLLSIRRSSVKAKLPAFVPTSRKPPLQSSVDNNLIQRKVKKSEERENNEDEDDDDDEEEWIAENRNLENGSPLRVAVAVGAANKAEQRTVIPSKNVQPQLHLQSDQRQIEPITGQTYELLILAAMSVSTFTEYYTIRYSSHLPVRARESTSILYRLYSLMMSALVYVVLITV